MWIVRTLVLMLTCSLAACATNDKVQSKQEAREAESNERLLLMEVGFVLTRDQIVAGELGFVRISNLYDSVKLEGLSDAEIDGGQVIAVRGSIYWVNTASGNTHNRLLVALLPKGVSVDPGNVVEARFRGPTRFLRVERVRAASMQAGKCQYVEALDPMPMQITKDILGFLSLIGPPGTATLYCKGIEDEGWAIEGRHWVKKLMPLHSQ